MPEPSATPQSRQRQNERPAGPPQRLAAWQRTITKSQVPSGEQDLLSTPRAIIVPSITPEGVCPGEAGLMSWHGHTPMLPRWWTGASRWGRDQSRT
jgi:hypothetical protein